MKKNIDLTIKNQLVLWGNYSVIITSGITHDIMPDVYTPCNCIVSYKGRYQSNLKNKLQMYDLNSIEAKLLSPLPPILNFKIHDNELY